MLLPVVDRFILVNTSLGSKIIHYSLAVLLFLIVLMT